MISWLLCPVMVTGGHGVSLNNVPAEGKESMKLWGLQKYWCGLEISCLGSRGVAILRWEAKVGAWIVSGGRLKWRSTFAHPRNRLWKIREETSDGRKNLCVIDRQEWKDLEKAHFYALKQWWGYINIFFHASLCPVQMTIDSLLCLRQMSLLRFLRAKDKATGSSWHI